MLTLLLAFACSDPAPTPTDPGAPPADGQPAPGAPAPGAPGPGDAAGPPPGGPPGGEGAAPGSPGGPPPGLAALVGSGASAKLTVKITGASSATMDFVVETAEGGMQVIAQERLSAETTTLTVPASYDKPVWVAAFSDQGTPGPDSADAMGVYTEALTFAGQDAEITIALQTGAPPPKVGPFGKAPAPGTLPPPPGGGPVPPGGAPGGSPPPGGAPPAPAPQ